MVRAIMQEYVNVEVSNTLLKKIANHSNFASDNELVESALFEFWERRKPKKLSDLKGKIKFSDNYDYKLLRNGQ